MKKHRVIFLLTFVCSLYNFTETLYADKICSFYFNTCPETFSKSTIYVPTYVTKLDPVFNICIPTTTVEGAVGKVTPPSIMFLIDNSNSMLGHRDDVPKDLDGSRFLVTRALIDSLKKVHPKAEVGLAVFRNQLVFDTKDDPIFVTPPGIDSGSTRGYIPLIRLDSTLANGMTGSDYLKMRLETKKVQVVSQTGDTMTATTLAYDKSLDGGTNINASFAATRDAMSRARNPKENQFVIFLSDGEASSGDNRNAYMQGESMPTTFTVFFTPGASGVAPQSMQTMTQNIKINGYSARNPSSDLWTIQTSFNKLMEVMMENIIRPILMTIKLNPIQMSINRKTYTPPSDTSTSYHISDEYVLKDGRNHYDIVLDYSIYIDPTIGTKDTTISFSFDVVRTDSVPQTPGIQLNCRDTIYYTVSVKATDANASEKENDPGTFEFSRHYSKGNLTVYYTLAGSATNGIDYTKIADSITFTDGQSTVRTTISPLTDSLKEGDETVQITLQKQRTGKVIRYNIGSSPSGTVTITDDYHEKVIPDSIVITVVPNPFSLSEPFNHDFKHRFGTTIFTGNVTYGTLIALYSSYKLEQMPGKVSYGNGILYDATGNIVKKLELQKSNSPDPSDSTLYGVVWDGTNMNNRKAGNGVYLLTMNIKSTSGIERMLTRKIGIKE